MTFCIAQYGVSHSVFCRVMLREKHKSQSTLSMMVGYAILRNAKRHLVQIIDLQVMCFFTIEYYYYHNEYFSVQH